MARRKISSIFLLFVILSSIVAIDLTRKYIGGEFDSSTVKLEVLYSSEKAGWLETVVEEFETQWSGENNQKIDVVMTPIGTGKGTIQVANEATKPTIWSPASSFWIPIINLLWKKNYDSNIADPQSPSLVVSPIVIATWRDYQAKNNISSLQDLHDLSINDPEFSFAHTNPYSSNSGFASVIMEVLVAANKDPNELTLKDLEDPLIQSWMRNLESGAVQYGSSTGFLAKLMANEGPERLKVAFLYENLVVEKNKEIKRKIELGQIPVNQTLVAVYPVEGTILNDHPFIILDAPWVNKKKTLLANEFIDFLKRPNIQEKAVEFGFRPVVPVDIDKIKSVFTETSGVRSSLNQTKIYAIGDMDAEVLDRIPDLWSATRSRTLDNEDNDANQLRPGDYIIPIFLIFIFFIMILSPVYSRLRK